MSEHKLKSMYLRGYDDAVSSQRRKTALIVVAVGCLSFWAGRASMRSGIDAAYEAGFDAGCAEATTKWEDWR